MRLVFMGTPDFAVPALEALAAAGHEIAAVYTQPPRPAGRGKKPRPSPVQARAEAMGLEVRHPVSLRDAAEQAAFAALKPEVAVVVAYGLILPRPILEAPARGCLNIHASLLPRWRGAAPIQRAIMAGDAETGVCIMQMEEGLDTGPVLACEATPIGAEETAGELHDRLAEMGARLIVEVLGRLDEIEPKPQSETGVTYAAKIDKAEARVDWRRPAVEIDRQIRGLSPFPGAWTVIGGERVKLLASRLAEGRGAPGEVLAGSPGERLVVACGQGAVEITRLQRAGRGAQEAAAFLRGHPVPKGARLGG
ncbi:methionyl-tRNA formyltransferase [Meinhardsimonia xiamenensis]|jgi:methionyl-tRNA formyltransferase|uniref:Methionyl-tRNA formyltransferase n=1 Tax=Meinhardsimonia xiamenensis TaxID=990712 RepID=A0A1G8XQB4_9RHOB|nr:methionyl-tRNA formyltransferase [Meinhardsimonia xiamenensis]PRX36999.1 methionyl-tRNA formyltransferase [Meinhardsimonia xiamenensis]SDJ92636.1 methionyl-tRNA formyltransferase [Meinhardsimonia xiamenensis]